MRKEGGGSVERGWGGGLFEVKVSWDREGEDGEGRGLASGRERASVCVLI